MLQSQKDKGGPGLESDGTQGGFRWHTGRTRTRPAKDANEACERFRAACAAEQAEGFTKRCTERMPRTLAACIANDGGPTKY